MFRAIQARLRRWAWPVCDICGTKVPPDSERCFHCGALFNEPRREYHEHMVTAAWRATSPEELEEIAGWVHDAYFDWEDIAFDAEADVATIPFAQEPTNEEECGQPGPRQVSHGRLGRRVYKVPFVKCALTIRRVRSCTIDTNGRDDPGMLNILKLDPSGTDLLIEPVTGPSVRVKVDGIDAQIDMTDELAFWIKRRKIGPVESDERWDNPPPE